MTGAEEGVLLLCCSLGIPEPRPLTMAQFRTLGSRVRASRMAGDPLSDVTSHDLERLGYGQEDAVRISALLRRERALHTYLSAGEARGIYPITRVSPAYPVKISSKQRLSATPVLFAHGDAGLLTQPSVSLVGSRRLNPKNEYFAQAIGELAARDGLVLVSGGAEGADSVAQEACLEHGGSCIIFVADRLIDHRPHPRVLYVSEDGYDLPFSPARALHRNGLIHIQGDRVFAAQCTYGSGGTWKGCMDNLSHHWSDLYVYNDGSDAMEALKSKGAIGIKLPTNLFDLHNPQQSLF